MIRKSTPAKAIFVGRSDECEGFFATLSELTTQRPWGLFGLWKGAAPKLRARVFIIQGSGGVGKTTLVQRFAHLASQSGIGWALCNWENTRDAGTVPSDLPALLSHLHNALIAQLGNRAVSAFEDFRSLLNKHAETKSKAAKFAAEVKPKYDAVVSSSAKTIGGVVSEFAPPGGKAVVGELAKAGVEIAGSGVIAILQELASRLSPEEYNLFTNPVERHANEFLKGLVELGKEEPFVLAQDTCELVARDNLQGEFRSLVVRPCLQKSSEIVFVLAGRSEMGRGYATAFQESPFLLQDSVLERFNLSEVGDYLAALGLPRELAGRVHNESLGLPYVLPLAATAVSGSGGPGIGMDTAVDIPVQVVTRVLSDVFEADGDTAEEIKRKAAARYRLYSLALVRGQDSDALRACWTAQSGNPVGDDDVRVEIAALRRANAFIFEESSDRLLSVFRDGAIRYIRAQLSGDPGWLDASAIRKLNEAALGSFEARLKAREREIPDMRQRIDDAEWKRLAAGVLSHRFWLDTDAAMREFCQRLIESVPFRAVWAHDLLAIAGESPAGNSALFQVLAAGVEDWTADPGTDLPLLAMWNRIAELLPKWNLPPGSRSLLALHRSRTLFRLKEFADAVQEAEAGLKIFPADAPAFIREGLVLLLHGRAGMLVQAREYADAITLARRGLTYDPGNTKIMSLLASALAGRKDFKSAHQVVDDFAAKYPGVTDIQAVRVSLFWMEGRNLEAMGEFSQLAKANPEAMAEFNRSILASFRDPAAMGIVSQLGRDAGLEDESLRIYARMAEMPEAAAEVLGATFRLIVLENPTNADILSVRKLTVDKFPDLAAARVDYAATLLADGQIPAALEQIAKARELSRSAQIALRSAALLILYGRYGEALPICEDAAARFPELPVVRIMWSKALALSDQVQTSLEIGMRALTDFPASPELKFHVGTVIMNAGQFEHGWQIAREGYLAATDLIREQTALNLLATAHFNPGQLQKLVDQFTTEWGEAARSVVRSFAPERQVLIFLEVQRALFEGEAPNAPAVAPLIPIWETLLESKPDDLSIRRSLAEFCREAGQAERAAQILEAGLTTGTLDAQARSDLHLVLSSIYRDLGRRADDLRHLRQVPDRLKPAGLRCLAAMMLDTGESDAALQTYEKANADEADPDFQSRLLFAQAYMGTRRFARAMEILNLLRNEQPGNIDTIACTITTLYYLGRFQESADLATQGSETEPGDPVIAAMTARSLRALGETTAAEEHQRRAMILLASATPYNQACILAILGHHADGLTKLSLAVANDGSVVSLARLDPDLLELRDTPGFEAILAVRSQAAAG